MSTERKFLDMYWDGRLPVDPWMIAERSGVRVIPDGSLAWGQDPLSGKFEKENNIPTIRFNPNESRVRQRFTIAHELGHCALGHGLAYRDPATNFSARTYNPDEIAANRFAASLLMPADMIEATIMDLRDPSVESLAELFGVSQVAMEFRLKNLGWLRG